MFARIFDTAKLRFFYGKCKFSIKKCIVIRRIVYSLQQQRVMLAVLLMMRVLSATLRLAIELPLAFHESFHESFSGCGSVSKLPLLLLNENVA